MTNISDQELLRLWKDPHFEGSFRGVLAFQTILKTNLNIDVSQKRLFRLFKNETLYLIHQKRKIIERRHYDLNLIGELVQADIAYMFDFEGFKYFLLIVDCFSSRLFAKPLKNKDSKSVTIAFKDFFKQFKQKVYKIESDRGSEFKGSTQELFRSKKIYYKSKFGKNKANYAERYIYFVKRKLYMILRSQLSENWPKYIKFVVDGYNNTPLKKLGYLTPNDIQSEKESVDVRLNKNLSNISIYKQPTFENQLENAKTFKNEKSLQVGDFCYKFYDENLFNKKYNISVRKAKLTYIIFTSIYFVKR